jgi:peroxiredoxin family protein
MGTHLVVVMTMVGRATVAVPICHRHKISVKSPFSLVDDMTKDMHALYENSAERKEEKTVSFLSQDKSSLDVCVCVCVYVCV